MIKVDNSYDASEPFKEVSDSEIREIVERCFRGESDFIRISEIVRIGDTVVVMRQDSFIVDVFTIKRHRIYELVNR